LTEATFRLREARFKREDSEYGLKRDPKIHVGLRYDRERLAEEQTGTRVNGPLPDGMSGGPIWLILPDGTPKLWAIGTDYDLQLKVLFGSKIHRLVPNLMQRHLGPTATVSLEKRAGE
jgi:hypothetical protein